MVLSLFTNCLLAIRNAMMDGAPIDPSELPLDLRKQLYKLIVIRNQTAENRSFKYLENQAFFDGFDEIDLAITQDCFEAETLIGDVFPSHFRLNPFLADNIRTLHLRVCTRSSVERNPTTGRKENVCRSNLQIVIDLIAECVQLSDLHLAFKTMLEHEDCGVVHDRVTTDKHTLELLALALLRNARTPLAGLHLRNGGITPVADRALFGVFSRLKRLTVVQVGGDGRSWRNLLASCRRTLVELHMEFFGCGYLDFHLTFPMPLPSLRRFVLHRSSFNQIQFNMLSRCEQLTLARINVVDNDQVLQLMNSSLVDRWPKVDLQVHMHLWESDATESLGKFCRTMGECLTVLKIINKDLLTHEVVQLIDRHCVNLQKLKLWRQWKFEMERNQPPNPGEHLLQLLIQRKARLRKLTLRWVIGQQTLDDLFAKMAHLEKLHLSSDHPLPVLNDDHLLGWIAAGARPKKLKVRCRNTVTSRGLTPVFRCCGERLTAIQIDNGEPVCHKDTVRVVMEECPMVKDIRWLCHIQDLPERALNRKMYCQQLVSGVYCHRS